MDEFSKFKNRILLYGLVAAGIFELISLIFLGLSTRFVYGLLIGTCIAVVNFNIMIFCAKRVLEKEKPYWSTLGYVIRFLIYGVVLYMTFRSSYIVGIGCGAGFLTIQTSIFYIHILSPKIFRKKKDGETADINDQPKG